MLRATSVCELVLFQFEVLQCLLAVLFCLNLFVITHLFVMLGNTSLNFLGRYEIWRVENIVAVQARHPLFKDRQGGSPVLWLVQRLPGLFLIAERVWVKFGEVACAVEVIAHGFDLEVQAVRVVLPQLYEFVVLVLLQRFLDFSQGLLGLRELLTLRLGRDVAEEVIRESLRVIIFVEAAAADFAHDPRPGAGDLLHDEQGNEDEDKEGVHNRVHLPESAGVDASQG